MEGKYFNLLKRDTQELVFEIESTIKKEIQVEVKASDRDILACNVDDGFPKIILPRSAYFPDSSVIHELIHIKRFLVEKVPLLTVSEDFLNKSLEQGFLAIDNDLEHLHVIKAEVVMRPERHEYWVGVFDQSMDRIDQSTLAQSDKDGALVRLFLLSEIAILNKNLSDKARDLIQSPAIHNSLDQFLVDIKSHLSSKQRISELLINFLDLKKYYPCLEYMDEHGDFVQKKLF